MRHGNAAREVRTISRTSASLKAGAAGSWIPASAVRGTPSCAGEAGLQAEIVNSRQTIPIKAIRGPVFIASLLSNRELPRENFPEIVIYRKSLIL
jgi:hypothetical protein